MPRQAISFSNKSKRNCHEIKNVHRLRTQESTRILPQETNKEMENAMTIKETIEVLRNHNEWRRGSDILAMTDPILIGQAIDSAVAYLEEIEKIKQGQKQ